MKPGGSIPHSQGPPIIPILSPIDPIAPIETYFFKVHNEELHNWYRSPNTSLLRVIKSRRLRWAGLVARMEKGRSAFKIFKT